MILVLVCDWEFGVLIVGVCLKEEVVLVDLVLCLKEEVVKRGVGYSL